MTAAETAFLTATAAHAGFQVTVTSLVYPALARLPAQQWAQGHNAHSRAITPLVAVIYGALVATSAWVLASSRDWWTLVAVAAVLGTLVSTVFAARLHERLGAGHDARLVGRLLRVDRVRMVGAVIAFLASAFAVTVG